MKIGGKVHALLQRKDVGVDKIEAGLIGVSGCFCRFPGLAIEPGDALAVVPAVGLHQRGFEIFTAVGHAVRPRR